MKGWFSCRRHILPRCGNSFGTTLTVHFGYSLAVKCRSVVHSLLECIMVINKHTQKSPQRFCTPLQMAVPSNSALFKCIGGDLGHSTALSWMDYTHSYFLVLDKPDQLFQVNFQNQVCYKRSALSLYNAITIKKKKKYVLHYVRYVIYIKSLPKDAFIYVNGMLHVS